ncbi:MAG TPA: hypothetical protein VII36_06575, partial [Usitatibacter sp.]
SGALSPGARLSARRHPALSERNSTLSWKQQKILTVLALAAALVINCWPLHFTEPPPVRTVSAAP